MMMKYEIKKEGRFQYVECGDGPVIIVLHGLFGALSNFKDVLDYFSLKYRVVIPIMPIYELPLADTNVRSLADFIKDFIEFKGFQSITLLGNSLGGHVSLVYMQHYPGKVHSVVLAGSSGLYENAFGGSFPRREDYNFIKQKVEITFYDPATATKELVDEVFAIISDKEKVLRTLALAKSAIRHNMAEELKHFDVPFCLIWGKNDIITPPEVAEEFHKLLPQSDLYWIDKCGHAPMMERPQEFNELLEKWLNKLFGH